MADKPKNADFFEWNDFVVWANENGVDLEQKEDWGIWWDCWCSAFNSALK